MTDSYNASSQDEHYEPIGMAPPAIGSDMVRGPVTSDGDTAHVHAFIYKSVPSFGPAHPDMVVYRGTLQFYNLMRGLRPRPEYPAGDPVVDPVTGEPTKFTVTGDPFAQTGWIDGLVLPPGSRRFRMSAGPVSLERGESVDVVWAQVGAIGATNHLSSLRLMRTYDATAQNTFDTAERTQQPISSETPVDVPRGIRLGIYPNPFNSDAVLPETISEEEMLYPESQE